MCQLSVQLVRYGPTLSRAFTPLSLKLNAIVDVEASVVVNCV